MRKVLIAVFIAAIALAAAPLSAQLYGTWAGQGSGVCYPRPDTPIYPWQNWKGKVYTSPYQDAPVFEGTWSDDSGNYGTFRGSVYFPPIEEQAIADGEWTWFDPLSMRPGPTPGGKFTMNFAILAGNCNGNWFTEWPSPGEVGTMKGEKVD
jgi:hypothetical protein